MGYIADSISTFKREFIWREMHTVYAGEFSLTGDYKKMTLLHSRSEIVQIELADSCCLIGSRDSLILCSTRNKDLTVLVDLPSFAPSISGACFTTGNNAAYCDESGYIKIINATGDVLWETLFGYQSGFFPGKLRFHHGGLISFVQSSVHLIDILDNKLKTVPVKGKITDCFCSETGDIIAAVSGQAVRSTKSKTEIRLPPKYVSYFSTIFIYFTKCFIGRKRPWSGR